MLFENGTLLYFVVFFKLHRFGIEGRDWHSAGVRRFLELELPSSPLSVYLLEIIRQGFGGAAKFYAPGLCGGDSLRLTLPNVAPLVFCHKGQHLQNNVAEKGPHQVLTPSGIQQRHIQHHNIDSFFFGKNTPLLQNFLIVAP